MIDAHHNTEPDRPFAPETIVVWNGWATAGELAILVLFLFVLPALAGVVR